MPHDPSAPPDDFTKAMRGLYFKVRGQLKEQNTYKHLDGATLARYVRAVFQAEAARAEMGEDPLVVLGSKEQEVAHPLLKVIREAEQDAHRFATDLLMTPAARKVEPKGQKAAGRLGL